ncbi:cGMP-dependent protein kinase 1 isoform X2 [Betta splendens]|uniref:cGMP-dependent protein kinase n=1 Tax=Betta splendens TaxID=158456 RepID=A0A8M1HIT9_BETSP|nr:cGMP-dependent protein kinase 1 isoform X2 [Betta splendens]
MGTLRDLQFALQLKIEELRQRDTLIDELELELDTKDELIRRLQEELDRYRATASLPGSSAASAACSAQGEDRQRARSKAVISEPLALDPVAVARVSNRNGDASQESQRLVRAAIMKNDLLKNLGQREIGGIVACVHPTTVKQGCCVLQEQTKGAQAYVLEEGRLDVTKDGKRLSTLEPGDMFGELALLYDCAHACSVSAQKDSKLWIIERRSFQTVLMQSGLTRLCHSMELLSSVPFLQPLPQDVIMKMSDLMEETHYSDGDYIIRQEAAGDTFYVISKGQVNVTETKPGHEEQSVLSKLSERQWFGEKALWGEDVRNVDVIAAGDVTCLVIDREAFTGVISGLALDSYHQVPPSHEARTELNQELTFLSSATLSDFRIVSTLAPGELGRIDLVQLKSNSKCLLAMRVLRKKLMFSSGQQEHVLREGRILMETRCPFIVRLHKTFRDTECLYVLTEACLGGDLRHVLTDKGCLDESSTRFYTACVVEALDFLHGRNVVYRDVKPENVVLDERGYAKLIGSRCLKRLEVGQKTWTFCGTLGYMAPEVILYKGHSLSADLWSLGVFVFELLSGGLPFNSADPMKSLAGTIRGTELIDFPKIISKSASSLIKKLCRSNPSERLGSLGNGAKDIQKHKWFEGFDWDGLCKRTIIPPVIPQVKYPLDSGTCGQYAKDSLELSTTWEDF